MAHLVLTKFIHCLHLHILTQVALCSINDISIPFPTRIIPQKTVGVLARGVYDPFIFVSVVLGYIVLSILLITLQDIVRCLGGAPCAIWVNVFFIRFMVPLIWIDQ